MCVCGGGGVKSMEGEEESTEKIPVFDEDGILLHVTDFGI